MRMWLAKYWLVLPVVLAISCVIWWEEERCQTQADQCRAEYTVQLRGIEPNAQAAEDQAIAAACEPKGFLCRLFGPANLPKRPWLVVSVVRNKESFPQRWFFRITNKGRTPAQLISGECGLTFKTNENELPVPPDYRPFVLPNNTFLPPDDFFDVTRTEAEGRMGMNPIAIIEQHFKGPDATCSGDILFFFGKIVYDDVLGTNRPGYERHQTRWCFAFYKEGMQWVRNGPNRRNWWKYNRNT